MSTEVEWNSGFLAGTSIATFEVDAHPEHSGEVRLWIEIQSAGGLTYNQGFGAAVPGGPVSSYVCVNIDIKTCPKAGAGTIGFGDAGSGEYLDNVVVTGENFVDGPDLGLLTSPRLCTAAMVQDARTAAGRSHRRQSNPVSIPWRNSRSSLRNP